jgi:hypothetical protein
MEEKLETKPSHYHSQPFKSDLVQETIYSQIVHAGDKEHYCNVRAMWVSFAVKHLLRAGLKDDVDIELLKAENYLHKARTGEWLDESN